MDIVTLGLVVVGAICLVAIFYKPKEKTVVEAPVAQESAPAVVPAKEVTSVASEPAKAKKPAAPKAAKPKAAKPAAKKAPAKTAAKKPTAKTKKAVSK